MYVLKYINPGNVVIDVDIDKYFPQKGEFLCFLWLTLYLDQNKYV